MKYLCLVYVEEKTLNALSRDERVALSDESMAYCDELQKNGQLLGASPLHPVEAATTVRVRAGKVSTTDGPFAETKEQLGGYLLIDVRETSTMPSELPRNFPPLSTAVSRCGRSKRTAVPDWFRRQRQRIDEL
jgi:hypothetical protein